MGALAQMFATFTDTNAGWCNCNFRFSRSDASSTHLRGCSGSKNRFDQNDRFLGGGEIDSSGVERLGIMFLLTSKNIICL